MKAKRLDYLDVSKAYLMIMVILGHILIVLNPDYSKQLHRVIQEYIYSFHMSAFYILHGITLNVYKWRGQPAIFVKKRFVSLMLPYLFFELIGILWRYVFQKQTIAFGLNAMVTLRCNVGADWFLPAMFLGSLILLFYFVWPNRIWGLVSVAICVILPMFMSGNQLLIVLGRGMLAYAFIMIGILGKELFTSDNLGKVTLIPLFGILIGIVAIINIKFGGNDFYTCIVRNPITLVLGGVCGTLLMISFSRLVSTKWITTIGKHTLTLMGTHQLVIYAMTAMIPSIVGGNLLEGLLLLTIMIIFEIPVVYLIDNYIPIFKKN